MRLASSQANTDVNSPDNLVDRKRPLLKWERRLQWQQNQPSEVLVFSGVGGSGKSTLCQMAIKEYLIPYKVPYAVVDFDRADDPPLSPEKTFSLIRVQLGKFGVKFPTFDVIWARQWEQVTGQKLSKSIFPSELGDVADIATIITIINFKSVANVLAKLSKWLYRRLSPKERDLALLIRDMNSDQLRHLMPKALAEDIEKAIEKEKHRGLDKKRRLTIIFDGFDRLLGTCKEEYRRAECDWWVREFCAECGSALKVICGREEVRWADQNPDLQQRIYHFTPLSNLPRRHADDYLDKRNVKDSGLRSYLINMTDGFPLYLKLAADLCNKIEKEGRKPTEKDFAGAESAKDLGKDLLSRLLRQLKDDERDAASLAAIPRWFTRDFLAALLPNPLLLDRLFDQLTSLAFCKSEPNIPAYTFRKEVRHFLLETPNPLESSGDWKHKLFKAYLYAADKLSMGRAREGVLYYEEEALALAEELGDALLQAQSYLRLASSHNRLQRFNEAVAMVGQAYLAAKRSGDQRTIAQSLMMRAGIETSRNPDYGDFSLIDRALRMFREIGDERGELSALYTKVGIALHKREYQVIEKPLEVAEQICPQLKDQHLSAITLQLRGEYHSHIGQWAVAAEYLQRARQAFEQVKAELPRTVGVCAATGWLGLAKHHLGDTDNGLALIHEALGTERDVLVSREGVAKWLHCLGELFLEQGKYTDALTTLWLCQIMRRELDHAELATTEKKIQEVRQKIGSKAYARMKKNFRPQDSDFYEYTYLRGIGPFRKYENNPVLVPQGSSWESRTVFNPAAWTDGKKVYMLYRAEGPCDFKGRDFCSRIGLATSTDGIHFTREAQPVLEPTESYEIPGGCEDPRITQIDDKFYMTYTAYDGKVARLAMATSYDLLSWEKKGLLFNDAQWDAYFPRTEYPNNPRGWSKSAVILPQKVKDRYWMYFGDTCIWAASTTDPNLQSWEIIPEPVLRPRPRHFDSKLVEPGPPLLILPEGIWLGYNGADDNLRYAFGQALFALDDPTRLIHRCTYPLLEPATEDELEGQVRQVVFAEGLVSFQEQRLLYYGMADSRIGVAIAKATPRESSP